MIDRFIELVTNGLMAVFRLPELVTIFIAILPIVEVRGAIPVAVKLGLNAWQGGAYAFIGSSLIVPILLLILLPIIRWLSRTKLFRKVGEVIYEKFEKKSRSISDKDAKNSDTSTTTILSPEQTLEKAKADNIRSWKKALAVFVFVAIPLPLTGVWTGSAVAAITKLSYPKSVLAVIGGNLVASTIITLLCAFLSEKIINIIILAIGIIAIAIVITLIVKIILHKSPNKETNDDTKI